MKITIELDIKLNIEETVENGDELLSVLKNAVSEKCEHLPDFEIETVEVSGNVKLEGKKEYPNGLESRVEEIKTFIENHPEYNLKVVLTHYYDPDYNCTHLGVESDDEDSDFDQYDEEEIDYDDGYFGLYEVDENMLTELGVEKFSVRYSNDS